MTFAKLQSKFQGMRKVELVALLINHHYNDFCGRYADDDSEKRIMYMGWYWRRVDFANLRIPIGAGGGKIGFMENNKWDYPERDLTEDEARRVIDYLDRAIEANSKGGQLSEIEAERDGILKELFAYMQTLKIDSEAYYATA